MNLKTHSKDWYFERMSFNNLKNMYYFIMKFINFQGIDSPENMNRCILWAWFICAALIPEMIVKTYASK